MIVASSTGAGGVARAALWALARHRVRDLVVLARDPERTLDATSFGARVLGFDRAQAGSGLVISALPPDASATEQALSVLPPPGPTTMLLDLAYGGLGSETRLVLEARARGHTAFDGRSLLLAQAARAYHLWMGGELSAIEQAMRDALKRRDSISPLL